MSTLKEVEALLRKAKKENREQERQRRKGSTY